MAGRWVLLGCVVGAIVGWTTFEFLATDGDEPPSWSEDADTIAALQREVDELRSRLGDDAPRLTADGQAAPPPKTATKPAANTATAQVTPEFLELSGRRIWMAQATFPKHIPEHLKGTPALWIDALVGVAANDHALGMHCRMALIAIGADATSEVEALARHPDAPASARSHALKVLERIAPERLGAVAGTLLAREPKDSQLRTDALRILAQTRPRSVPDVIRSIATDEDATPQHRHDAMRALLNADPEAAETQLRHMLNSRDPAETKAAYQVLAHAARPELRPLLNEAVQEAPANQRAQLFGALARMKGPDWGNEQMTGPPDTTVAGDQKTAWAPLKSEGGAVTVQLGFDLAVVPEQVRVHENCAPGAIVKVEGMDGAGRWIVLWEGGVSPASPNRWFAPPVAAIDERIQRVRLTLDTDAVKGWNEIDAVELIGDGQRQWASSAESSSCYANRNQ